MEEVIDILDPILSNDSLHSRLIVVTYILFIVELCAPKKIIIDPTHLKSLNFQVFYLFEPD